jgi:hypothetical protein
LEIFYILEECFGYLNWHGAAGSANGAIGLAASLKNI